jgi:HSP20 family protein
MRNQIHAVALPSEVGDFADEVRRVFLELGRVFTGDALAGECAPAIDVYETDDSVEVTVDLPGVPVDAIRLVSKGESILIAGEKAPRRVRGESSFHLVERGYGRFARVVRRTRACDTSKASAELAEGELHISVPKIPDRRGTSIPIKVRQTAGAPS